MSQPDRILKGQGLHIVGLATLIAALLAARTLPGFQQGSLWGVSSEAWVWLGVGNAVLHQVYIWVHWFATEKPDMRVIYGVQD